MKVKHLKNIRMRWISMLRSRQNKVYGTFIMFINNANKLKEISKPITKLL
jgi:hypothetical protein